VNKYYSDNHPVESDWNSCRDAILNCAELTKKAIDASDDDDEADITNYKNLVVYYESVCELKCYTGYGEYTRGMQDSGVRKYRGLAQDAKNKIEAIKKSVADKKAAEEKKAEEEKQARIKAYWEAHADEKTALESEKKELEAKRDSLTAQVADLDKQLAEKVPSEEESEKLKTQIKELEDKRSKLGLFAGKEKKQIAEEIATLQGRVDSLKSKVESEHSAKDAPLKTKKAELSADLDKAKKRISAIEAEFTKDPE